MPGRTTKALTHLWANLRKEAEASAIKPANDEDSGDTVATAGPSEPKQLKKPATPRKKKAETTEDGMSP